MNILQVFEQFPTQRDCIAHLERARWGERPRCGIVKLRLTAGFDAQHGGFGDELGLSILGVDRLAFRQLDNTLRTAGPDLDRRTKYTVVPCRLSSDLDHKGPPNYPWWIR